MASRPRNSRSTGSHCSVNGCSRNQRQLNGLLDQECFDHKPLARRNCKCEAPFRLFKMPDDPDTRRLWLAALRRETPPKNVFVCSFHFLDRQPTAQNPIPELFLGYEKGVKRSSRRLVRSACEAENKEPKSCPPPKWDVRPAKRVCTIANCASETEGDRMGHQNPAMTPEVKIEIDVAEDESLLWGALNTCTDTKTTRGEASCTSECSHDAQSSLAYTAVDSDSEVRPLRDGEPGERIQSEPLRGISTQRARRWEPIRNSDSCRVIRCDPITDSGFKLSMDSKKEEDIKCEPITDTDTEKTIKCEPITDTDTETTIKSEPITDTDTEKTIKHESITDTDTEDKMKCDCEPVTNTDSECELHCDRKENIEHVTVTNSDVEKRADWEPAVSEIDATRPPSLPQHCDQTAVLHGLMKSNDTLLPQDSLNKCPNRVSDSNKGAKKCFGCDTCKKVFGKTSELKTHSKIHTEEIQYICKVCNTTFDKESELIGHVQIHRGKKPFVCDVCDKAFGRASSLIEHTSIHTRKNRFVCGECHKAFATANHLDRHSRIHLAPKPYVCAVCSKAFSYRGNLDNHTDKHTGQGPYVCNICSKALISARSLNVHMETHREQKALVCKVCSKTFSEAGGLNQHMRVHTTQVHTNTRARLHVFIRARLAST